jgi:adenosine deaminase
MNLVFNSEFIKRIPKTDLHVHLDGSLRLSTLIDLAKKQHITLPSYEEAGMREMVFKEYYLNLADYLKGFAYTVGVLSNKESLEQVAYELAMDNIAENVRYIEVRFAPQLHINKHLNIEQVLLAVDRGLSRAKIEHNRSTAVVGGDDIPFEYGIIVCAMRFFTAHFSEYYADLFKVMNYAPQVEVFRQASLELARSAVAIRNAHGIPIVGFDLAGEEDGYPAEDHQQAFFHAHRNFLKKTVHAGEAYGPESIFQAITDLHAERIGHGTFLFDTGMIRSPNILDKRRYVADLAGYIAHQRITIEVCLTSNLQTNPAFSHLSRHPFKDMLENKLSATICTDNRLMSNTTLTREIEIAIRHFNISSPELKNLVVYGFKRSFFPGSYSEKRHYVRRAIEQYERIEAETLATYDPAPTPAAKAQANPDREEIDD